MKCTVKAFGVAREILRGGTVEIEFPGNTVRDLRSHLAGRFPELAALNSLFIAVNQSYAGDETPLSESDEIALIPPVSGG